MKNYPACKELKIFCNLLSDLGSDGCMSEFSWASGGHYGKQWGEHLPTDAGVSHREDIHPYTQIFTRIYPVLTDK